MMNSPPAKYAGRQTFLLRITGPSSLLDKEFNHIAVLDDVFFAFCA